MSKKRNWNDSKAKCESLFGSHLPVISDKTENEQVNSMFIENMYFFCYFKIIWYGINIDYRSTSSIIYGINTKVLIKSQLFT